ncbi:MAG: bifunctional phosphopantothenoylcysteine decarboxylase/phosphopantothenate--cysteine ligase CoaBC [Prevotellaceae bacterium]|jgi:phosphopantothenoylcysteine decarboxylase/phosphopantothenate--cysteine ligase|nr:bifunctional phosphopantothenoylcysteine decarboxylase/phosphopantothenate--cysteine ligase CoaBC [Prevotellaceae bacterium]
MLKGKHILLGITGSIAAYKAATLIRLLTKEGAEVQVVMTASAKYFITPLTMATLSKRPVLVEFYNPENGNWNSHVSLGEWADYYLIAPATANTMAKMVHGIADNLLLTAYLSARCPVIVAPAMDVEMYNHPANVRNMALLKERGVMVIDPASGSLASGLEGKGRMEEPEKIVQFLQHSVSKKKTLSGYNVLVTAGPTYEAIDPIRFIGNHSSGKMGYALAEEFAARGATVTLISGPTALNAQHPHIKTIPVVSAVQMHAAAAAQFETAHIAVLCAAVADFTPQHPAGEKIKRGKEPLQLQLQPTVDIAAELGRKKTAAQILVGFALETDHELPNAQKKMTAKNLDMIVLNSLNDAGAGFGCDTNKVTLLYRNGTQQNSGLKPKSCIAADIIDAIQSIK